MTSYIAEGRDREIIDPDHAANISAKLERLEGVSGEAAHPDLVKVPKCALLDAPGWTSYLSRLPCFAFPTMHRHFAECSAKDVDVTQLDGGGSAGNVEAEETEGVEKFPSFRGLDKGYRFFFFF